MASAGPVDAVASWASQNNSYAGPGAYDSQVPMKVFMGNAPCVPLNTVMDALKQKGPQENLPAQHLDFLMCRQLLKK